ncbi:MAG: carbohydrate-binding domain-containing protein, partial [Austwickia sp.]|nr:carbohydrate-binding domain-containing protein [Austwickia sp.]
LRITDGTVTVAAGDDGMHAEGDLSIEGGTVRVTRSAEGLEGANIVLAGGSTTVTASDDGVNASAGSTTAGASQGGPGGGPGGGGGMANTGEQLIISGGTTVVTADGDGLDSNGTIAISGGTTVVNGPTTNGNGALDSNGGITVTGGTVLAAGSAGMAEAPGSASTQGWVQVGLPGALQPGTTVQLVDNGRVVASYTATRSVQNIVLAGADIAQGQSYDVYVGGRLAADAVADTFSLGGDGSGATKTTTVTAGQATGGMGGGMGGGFGGPR